MIRKMAEENTISKLEKKARRGRNLAIIGGIIAIIGYGVAINEPLRISQIEEPKIYQEYQNAKTTLKNLEELGLNEQSFPYKTEDIKKIIDPEYEIPQIDSLVKIIKVDISKMKDNPEISKYEKDTTFNNYKTLGGLGTFIIAALGFVAPGLRKKYNAERKIKLLK